MNITLLCPNCSKCADCQDIIDLLEHVAAEKKRPLSLEIVEDMKEIRLYSIVCTPGIVINGRVVHLGSVPGRKKVESWFI